MPAPTPRIVDFKLPLPWLISGAVAMALFMISLGWQASAQSNKLDTLILTNVKMEKRLDDRDVRLDTLRDAQYAQQRTTDTNSLRITALESARK
jgi:hypothetical protein